MDRDLSSKREVNWGFVLWDIHLYILGTVGIWRICVDASWLTVLFTIFIIGLGSLGITIGAHRLWAHQSFEANWFVKLTLMLCHTLAGVGPIHDWVLAHRMHHKFYGTDKDPYNHKKGFLYSHVISHFLDYPENYEWTSRIIDMRDMESDGYVWFQKKFYWPLLLIVGLLLPINAPAEYWDETVMNAFLLLGFTRLAVLMHISSLVNSAMHIWGLKATDKFPPDDNLVFLLNRSFWLNYHYILPWDWKTDEFGGYETGVTSFIIKALAEMGLINGLKTAESSVIRETLYKAATTKKSLPDLLDEVKKAAEYETAKIKLKCHH